MSIDTVAPPLFLGLDASTQALKASLLDEHLAVLSELEVRFDRDLPRYGTTGGVLPLSDTDDAGTVVAPVMLYVEAMDLLADKIKAASWPVDRIQAISAAGQQHASVYFSRAAPRILTSLSHSETLAAQTKDAFSRAIVPNWQDSSTVAECKQFEQIFGGPKELARRTGSKAHTRFTGPQILKFRKQEPQAYIDTERIGLVSSLITTLLCVGQGGDPGRVIKNIDQSDACGMNLLDMRPKSARSSDETGSLDQGWNYKLLQLASGELDESTDHKLGGAKELARKLGYVYHDSGATVGNVGSWWVERHGFNPDCRIYPGTGDNPATFLAFSLAERQAIVSLGTSDTVMVATNQYVPDPEFHAFFHPAQLPKADHSDRYFNMLVYKSGSLAREWIRDEYCSKDWATFNSDVETHRLPGATEPHKDARVGFYWLRPEIIPAGASGLHRYTRSSSANEWQKTDKFAEEGMNAAAILETQFLNYRYRSSAIVSGSSSSPDTSTLPLETIYAVGGASANSTITQVMSDVFGASIVKPVQLGEDGHSWVPANYNFCSVGAAYKAVWGWYRAQEDALQEEFDDFIHRIKTREAEKANIATGKDNNTAGGVQVICSPRQFRTQIYTDIIDQWKSLEDAALQA